MKLPELFNKPSDQTVLVSASYGRAIPNEVLSRFAHRLNVHPSLIPKYRGAAPIQWTLINGDARTGVSIINMEDVALGFDVGDIHAVRELVSVRPPFL
jgi:methionyl-tRNA formyltransferase